MKQNDDPTEDTRSDGYDEPHASETEVVHGIEGSPAKKSFPRCDAEATKDKRPTYGLAAKQTTPVSSTPEHSKDLIAMEVLLNLLLVSGMTVDYQLPIFLNSSLQ